MADLGDSNSDGFWLLDKVIESEFGLKVTKYAIGSVIALITSVVVFAVLLWVGVGTTIDSVAAFIAGAVPNWVLNRRWAWERTEHKLDVTREVVGYTVVSLISLAAASAGTGWTHHWVNLHVRKGDGARVILVTGAYVLIQAILFFAKFVVYDRWVFTGESRFRKAIRARLARRNAARRDAQAVSPLNGRRLRSGGLAGGDDHWGNGSRALEGRGVEQERAPLGPDAGDAGVEVQLGPPPK